MNTLVSETRIAIHYHLAQLLLNHANIRDVGSEQADRSNHSRGNRNTLGDGLGGISDCIQVGHNLAGFLGLLIFHIMPGHLANSIGIVRDRTIGVHGNIVASMAEHTDTDHGDGIENIFGIAGTTVQATSRG